jgi:hypothetical protein
MAGGFSTYLEAEILKHLLRTGSWTKPAAIWVGLFTAAPTDAGGGTEVTGGSYARVQRNALDANWGAPAKDGGGLFSTSSNSAAITFPAPTANWGTVTHFALFDASTGGNMLLWQSLSVSKTVNNGDSAPSFAIGQLVVSQT